MFIASWPRIAKEPRPFELRDRESRQMDAMEEDREGRSNGTKRRCDSQRSADSAGGNELSSEQQHGHPLATNRADGTHRRADGVEKAAAEGGPSMLTPAQVQKIAKNREEALRRRRDREHVTDRRKRRASPA